MSESRFSRQIRFTPFRAGRAGASRRLNRRHCRLRSLGHRACIAAGARGRGDAAADRSRLHRREQPAAAGALHRRRRARRVAKAEAARRHLLEANSGVRIEALVSDLNPENAEELLGGTDAILDGTDNFETRLLINDYAVREDVPWIYGAAVGSYGIAMPILPDDSACFRCVYPEPPSGVQPTCETAGVLGPVTSLIGSIQAMEALKILAGRASAVRRKIFTADLWNGPVRESSMPARDPQCPACGRREFAFLNGRRRAPVSLCGRNAVQIHELRRPSCYRPRGTPSGTRFCPGQRIRAAISRRRV